MQNFDVIILGSGVAGLSTAIRLIEQNKFIKIAIVTKSCLSDSSTNLAQGGIALALDKFKDSCEKHVNDTMDAGAWTNNLEVVKFVVNSADEVYRDLVRWKFHFDKDEKGRARLHKEGGHQEARIFHHKDFSGMELENKLIDLVSNSEQITILNYHFAIDLIFDNKSDENVNFLKGVQVYSITEEEIIQLPARFCLISTGGCGQVYSHTSNPRVATGDGVAMASRAKCEIEKMNFIQFHPTVIRTCTTAENQPILTEALRGSGAYIVNSDEHRFLFRYHKDGELACRDVVSYAIEHELKNSNAACAFLDLRHLDQFFLKENYPQAIKILQENKIDYTCHLIPIRPAAHYQCGGIRVNLNGETNVKGLYACGECASTGLHGNNRLASNSLLEAIVFSKQVATHILNNFDHSISLGHPIVSFLPVSDKTNDCVAKLRSLLKKCMSDKVGVINSLKQLERALVIIVDIEKKFSTIQESAFSIDYFELRNLIETAKLICNHRIHFEKSKYELNASELK